MKKISNIIIGGITIGLVILSNTGVFWLLNLAKILCIENGTILQLAMYYTIMEYAILLPMAILLNKKKVPKKIRQGIIRTIAIPLEIIIFLILDKKFEFLTINNILILILVLVIMNISSYILNTNTR